MDETINEVSPDSSSLNSEEIQALADSFEAFRLEYSDNVETSETADLARSEAFEDFASDLFGYLDQLDTSEQDAERFDLLITTIQEQAPPDAVEYTAVDTVGYYADLALLLVIFVGVPIFVLFKIISPIFSLFGRIV